MKEVEKLKDIYYEIKKYNLRHLSGDEHEIQDFIDKVIDCMYKKIIKMIVLKWVRALLRGGKNLQGIINRLKF